MIGPDGPVYPGICRGGGHDTGALRLNMGAAMARLGAVSFVETGVDAGTHRFDATQLIETVGDIVLARRDIGTSYHIAVVVDDAAQGVTEVTRGQDLFAATAIHVVLQRLLDLPTPAYHHHRLIRDDQGKRLAKRDDARALSKYRAEGATPADIRRMVGL
jgi:glutamyl-Q tRNA(Asp) synthetase